MSNITESKQHNQWNWHNFFVCLSLSCGAMAYGYPAAVIGTILGQPSFLRYMKLVNEQGEETPDAPSLIGSINGAFQAGAFFGVLCGGLVLDRWGRKAGIIYCAILSIIGNTMCCAAQNVPMFIVFRFVSGGGSWAFLSSTSVYVSELAPPKFRGFFTGMIGVAICIGFALSGYLGLAFYSTDDLAAQWRGTLGLGLIFPVFMLIVVYFVPESPRYLLLKGREEEARAIVIKLHHIKGAPDQEYARSEFYQMQKEAEYDRSLTPSWKQMFTRSSYRNRVLIACSFAVITQSTAVLVINNYAPSLFAALGYGVRDRLVLQCGYLTVAIPFNILGAAIMDRVGRKKLMYWSVAGCCLFLIIEAAMLANFASPIPEHPNKAGLAMGVAAFYLFLAVFSVGVDVVAFVYYSEIFPNHIRAKGVTICTSAYCLISLVYVEAAPTAFANIGWKYFLVFIIISGLSAIFIYFVYPETKGIPLEEIAAIFGDADEVMVYSRNVHVNNDLEIEVYPTTESPQSISESAGKEGAAREAGTV
ncbi:hypothetical protein V501_08116 [Pseudogymnoascus sp. VKM F-4519 (FW-2642)]|nr:hypothetical protein V501_08116 [Pseudogymnoascus sp. VKM F-4519 (FW-2642)]